MRCRFCGAAGDPDAVFCVRCGGPMASETGRWSGRKPILIIGALVLLVVVIGAAAWGYYYKFILPDGVAAVVNGEVIRISELEAELSRIGSGREGNGATCRGDEGANSGSLRYRVLNGMITDRIAAQEARRAGMEVTKTELAAALAHVRDASGGDEDTFRKMISDRFGSLQAFERKLTQDLLVRKFLGERVAPAGADEASARAAADRWLRNASKKASVRIAMAEQWSAGGYGCCNGAVATGSEKQPGATPGSIEGKGRAAADAALAFWKDRYGDGPFTARTTDFGCHIQVDILRGGEVVGSLRYQDGSVARIPNGPRE